MPSARLNEVLDSIAKEYRPKKEDILAGICTLLHLWSLHWPGDPLGWELRRFLKAPDGRL